MVLGFLVWSLAVYVNACAPSRAGSQAIRRVSVHKKHPTLELSVDQDGAQGLVSGPCAPGTAPVLSAAERLEALRERVRAKQAMNFQA